MRRISSAAAPRPSGDRRALAFTLLFLCLAGCGPAEVSSPTGPADDSSGFLLPPDFKPVDLPLARRKEIFKEAHEVRALAVQEANLELPMDEAHLPHLDTKAFDKRVADHKAIIGRILEKNLAALAEKHKIGVADVSKIEDEANKLRWLPPADPVFKPAGPDPGSKEQAAAKGGAEAAKSP